VPRPVSNITASSIGTRLRLKSDHRKTRGGIIGVLPLRWQVGQQAKLTGSPITQPRGWRSESL